ncbi:MAG: HAD-IC family P-type ATPase, partial [Bacteroidales bacterium]
MTNFYSKQSEEVLKEMNVSQDMGLSPNDVKIRREKYGLNRIDSQSKKSFILMFLKEFKSFMIIILLIAAIISGVIGIIEGEGLLDSYIILGILVVNALIGAIQQKKAETSLEALKNMSSPHSKVLRDGAITQIVTTELVIGDIVILETGDIVPADLRLIEAINLKVQESSMTGESLPVGKQTEVLMDEDVALGDRTNMAFTTGMVTYGRGVGIVVAIGMNTEVGKIAKMIQNTVNTKTPMEKSLDKLGKTLGIAVIIICLLIFFVGILYGNSIMT